MDGHGKSHSLRGFSRGVAVVSDVSLMLELEWNAMQLCDPLKRYRRESRFC